jgi:Fic family protein
MDLFKSLTQAEKKVLLQQMKIEWTYSSNAIEGNTLSLGDTQFIIENGLTVKGKSIKEHNEVIGHARAIDLIYEMLDKAVLTQEDIFLLHRSILTEVVVDIYSPIGAYKSEDNGRYISVNNQSEYLAYPSVADIQHLMQLWLAYFNAHLHIDTLDEAIEVYTYLHLSFSSIHPFFDGNGRLARLLANIPLLKNGFLPLVVKQENRQEYIQTLSSYQLRANPLNRDSRFLIQETTEYSETINFFKEEYKNIQNLLKRITSK